MTPILNRWRGLMGPVLALLIVTMLVGGVADAAEYPLEIVAPRSGQSTSNRYYKAYPGLTYDVNVAAIGGRYPYTFSLATAPSGMSIDADTGRITWSNPTAQSSAYPVTATVRDASGKVLSVSWTVLVTTSGFKFVDAVNGKSASQGGDGSRDNPWRTISDWFQTKYDTSYKGQFLYWRKGTYRTADAPIEDGIRLPMSGSKPIVWLAYPGESPVIDTTGSYLSIDTPTNLYFDGMTIQNFTTGFGVHIGSAGNDVMFRRNTLRNLPSGAGGTGTNAAAIMIVKGESKGARWAFLDNQFSAIHDIGYGILGYSTDRVLVQGNRFSDFTVRDSKAIGPKMNNSMWFIRDNRINISAGQGIWVDTYSTTQDVEISYNLVKVQSGYSLWVGQELATYGAITSLRNTYIGAPVTVDNLVGSSGPVSFDRDVIVNDSSATANRITTNSSQSILSAVKTQNLLVGSLSAGIVNSDGDLTGSYEQYVGTRGYQRTGTTDKAPASPTLSVQ